MPEACPVYRPRKPHLTPHYQCVQDHFETLEQVWPERFEKHFGFWRPYLKEVMMRYLACGDLHAGFARLVCQSCGRNFLLAYLFLRGPLRQLHPGQAAKTATARPHPHRAGAADLFGAVSQELGTPDPEGL